MRENFETVDLEIISFEDVDIVTDSEWLGERD